MAALRSSPFTLICAADLPKATCALALIDDRLRHYDCVSSAVALRQYGDRLTSFVTTPVADTTGAVARAASCPNTASASGLLDCRMSTPSAASNRTFTAGWLDLMSTARAATVIACPALTTSSRISSAIAIPVSTPRQGQQCSSAPLWLVATPAKRIQSCKRRSKIDFAACLAAIDCAFSPAHTTRLVPQMGLAPSFGLSRALSHFALWVRNPFRASRAAWPSADLSVRDCHSPVMRATCGHRSRRPRAQFLAKLLPPVQTICADLEPRTSFKFTCAARFVLYFPCGCQRLGEPITAGNCLFGTDFTCNQAPRLS